MGIYSGHAQADFGESLVRIGGVEQKAHFFVLDLPHSDACYVWTYPAAVAEAWMDGHIHAFAFFGAVLRPRDDGSGGQGLTPRKGDRVGCMPALRKEIARES